MNLVPSYGRDYKSKLEVEADWAAGKDFTIADISSEYDGKQCSCRDFPPTERITIRYKKLRNVHVTKGRKGL